MRDLVPRGHPFRDLRNYYQVWPFREGEDDWWMEPDDPRPPQVEPFVVRPKTVGPHPADPYLGRRLHDARMIGIQVSEDAIRLDIDDYDVWRLSTAFEEVTGHPPYKEFFPIVLEFRDLHAWAGYQINPLGHLSRLHRSLASNLGKAREFYGDLVIQWDETRVIAFFEIFLRGARETRLRWDPKDRTGVIHAHELLLAVDAKRLEVHEGQREAWRSAYGAESLPVFEAFLARRSKLAQGAYEPFRDLVREVLAQEASPP